mgnify:CR=1 FL=1
MLWCIYVFEGLDVLSKAMSVSVDICMFSIYVLWKVLVIKKINLVHFPWVVG